MSKKDPYGFEEARALLATEEGREAVKKALEESAKKIEERNKKRIVTEEQWKQVYNL